MARTKITSRRSRVARPRPEISRKLDSAYAGYQDWLQLEQRESKRKEPDGQDSGVEWLNVEDDEATWPKSKTTSDMYRRDPEHSMGKRCSQTSRQPASSLVKDSPMNGLSESDTEHKPLMRSGMMTLRERPVQRRKTIETKRSANPSRNRRNAIIVVSDSDSDEGECRVLARNIASAKPTRVLLPRTKRGSVEFTKTEPGFR
ncbi:hypothetical protein FA15DRAFT_67546 [Coprinopsis marcescibilis]|uniref:Uncharacterized protein n=1 Tax=Coprinopsis marcescibilis TaxID=230819 RepID=A0A5C3KN87_COPMA|nr:hypothetical protein FA15DRAFT_67546 [Coprinopsis marcescibilis]